MYEELKGKTITVFCMNYIYTGKLVDVADGVLKLEDPSIVYETGPFDQPEWADVQALPGKYFHINANSIESFGICK